ncbi:MAG TPA: hypothetical protein VGD74_05275 [Vulgatibacter sp.]
MSSPATTHRVTSSSLCALAGLAVSIVGCASGKFVEIAPVNPRAVDVPSVMQQARLDDAGRVAPPVTGYLRIEVSSNVTSLHRGKDFDLDGGLDYLFATLELSTGRESSGEIPVVLYDLGKQSVQANAGVNLARNQYVNLSAANEPGLTLKIVAVPKSGARTIKSAVEAFQKATSEIPIVALSGAAPAIKMAGNVLTAVTGAAIPSDRTTEWILTQRFGWGGDTPPLPLDGRTKALLLVPVRGRARGFRPTDASVAICRDDSTRLCQQDGVTPFTALPYFLIKTTLQPYRTLEDFGVSFSCAATQPTYDGAARVLNDGWFTQEQRTADQALLRRLRILLDVKDGKWVGDPEVAANLIFRYLAFNEPTTPVWSQFARATDQRLQACIQDAVKDLGPRAATVVWPIWMAALDTATRWESLLGTANGAADSTAILRKVLHAVDLPLRTFELKAGDAFMTLDYQRARIAERLVPFTMAAIRTQENVPDSNLRDARAALLDRVGKDSDCSQCVALLQKAIEDLSARQAKGEAAAAARTKATADAQLAAAQAEAKDVIVLAGQVGIVADTANIAATVQAQKGGSLEGVRAAANKLRAFADSSRRAVRDSVAASVPPQ